MPHRAIVLFPALEGIEQIEAVRRRYDPLAAVIPAHITLVFPFDSAMPRRALRAHIAQAVRGCGPFAVRLQGITGHAGEYLFLNVTEGQAEVVALHDRLYSGALAPYHAREPAYQPHITVGRLSEPGAFRRALQAVRTVTRPFEGRVSEVAVFAFGRKADEFRVAL